jgi:hypothetical protein
LQLTFNNAIQRIYGGGLFFVYYLASVFFAWRTIRLLKEKFSGILINKKVQRVQGQLARALLAQVCFNINYEF